MNEKYLNEGCWRGGRSMLSFIENIIGPDLHIERVKRSGRGQLSLSVWPLSLSLCVCQAVMQTSSLVFNLHVCNCLSLQRICLSLLFSVCLSLTPHTLTVCFSRVSLAFSPSTVQRHMNSCRFAWNSFWPSCVHHQILNPIQLFSALPWSISGYVDERLLTLTADVLYAWNCHLRIGHGGLGRKRTDSMNVKGDP